MDTIDNTEAPKRRLEDQAQAATLDWTKPDAPAVPAAQSAPARIPLRAVASMCVKTDDISFFSTPAAKMLEPGHYMLSIQGAAIACKDAGAAPAASAAGSDPQAQLQAAAPSDLQQLKALALAATPGEWRQCVGGGATELRGDAVGDQSSPRVCRVLRDDPKASDNAAYIAAASPAVVLDLIARIERSEESVAQYQQSAHELAEELRAARIERAAAPADPLWIQLGQGKIEIGQGHHGPNGERLPAILFGRNGAGAVGIETEGDRTMKPGECLCAVTFENPESLDVVAEKLAELRARIWPAASPAAASGDMLDIVSKALNRAWQLGQTYWQQADSESYKQNMKSRETEAKFDALIEETRAAVSADTKPTSQSIDHDAFWVLVAHCRDAKPGAEYETARNVLVGYVDRWAAATKPTADLSSLPRYDATPGAMIRDESGYWVPFRAVQSLLATKPAAAPMGEQAAEPEPEECWSFDKEDFSHRTLGDLIDSHDLDLKPGDTVWLADAVRPELNRFIDADDVMTTMGERAYDIAGEHAEGYPDVTKDAERELEALLAGWISKHCAPTFWTVENIRPYRLSNDDFPSDRTPVEAELAAQPTMKGAGE